MRGVGMMCIAHAVSCVLHMRCVRSASVYSAFLSACLPILTISHMSVGVWTRRFGAPHMMLHTAHHLCIIICATSSLTFLDQKKTQHKRHQIVGAARPLYRAPTWLPCSAAPKTISTRPVWWCRSPPDNHS